VGTPEGKVSISPYLEKGSASEGDYDVWFFGHKLELTVKISLPATLLWNEKADKPGQYLKGMQPDTWVNVRTHPEGGSSEVFTPWESANDSASGDEVQSVTIVDPPGIRILRHNANPSDWKIPEGGVGDRVLEFFIQAQAQGGDREIIRFEGKQTLKYPDTQDMTISQTLVWTGEDDSDEPDLPSGIDTGY
jgi:hypothetical protein